jgi:hypothetical protein
MLIVLVALGCSESGKDVMDKLAPRFRELNARLTPMAKALPPSPVTERPGGALQPPAVMGEHGNTWLLNLWGLADHVDLCVNIDGWLDKFMALSQGRGSDPVLPKLRGGDVQRLRATLQELLALRYVVFERMVDCKSPDGPDGSATVEGFLVDVTTGKVERIVRVSASAAGGTLGEAANDRLLGALAGRAGVDVRQPGLLGKTIVPITTPDAPPAPEAPTKRVAKATGRCTVDTPEAGIEDVGGGMPCDEAEALAKTLRAKGFDAKVLPAP